MPDVHLRRRKTLSLPCVTRLRRVLSFVARDLGANHRVDRPRCADAEDVLLDTIFIDQLAVETLIGVYDWERRIRQRVVIDLEMDFDIRKAAASDDVAHTLNYKAVAKRVIAFVESAEYLLVETLSERIAALILDEFPVTRVSLRLNKPYALRGAAGVGIRITRENAS